MHNWAFQFVEWGFRIEDLRLDIEKFGWHMPKEVWNRLE